MNINQLNQEIQARLAALASASPTPPPEDPAGQNRVGRHPGTDAKPERGASRQTSR